MGHYKYDLEPVEFGEGDASHYGQWCSQELSTYGDTLEELIENAVYFIIDQDGGELDQTEADDIEAIEYIVAWFNAQDKS